MRRQRPGRRRSLRLVFGIAFFALMAALLSGLLVWLLAQTAAVLSLHLPVGLSLADARAATARLILLRLWRSPSTAFPPRVGLHANGAAWLAAIVFWAVVAGALVAACWWRVRSLGSGSPLGRSWPVRWLRDRQLVSPRTWASSSDLRRLWVPEPMPGRPYLGWAGSLRPRMLAAEREVQLAVVAPPRSGKSTGYVIPWLLDHTGPALVLSVKRDVYDATVAHRRRLGQVWVYDPFGPESCSYTPLSTAHTWEGAIRAALALAGAARNDHTNAATDFWDREAAVLLAPLMHAATVSAHTMASVLDWLDSRDYDTPAGLLANIRAEAAKTQLLSILARDPRNRETTVMSAAALLRAYRYPRVTQQRPTELSPAQFFSGGGANTIYVVAAAHHQRDLQPVILALVAAIYETAIDHARARGAFRPELYLLLDEAANIAPVRDLPMWLSQCGDHGITIATSWQSIAQIDARYGRHERDAILAATTAQLFLPPLADPTTTEYVTGLLGKEPVGHSHHGHGLASHETVGVSEQNVADTARLRQMQSERALLVYRDLPPAMVGTPRWYGDPRFAVHRKSRQSC